MFSRLLILFIVVPMIELMVLIEVGKEIGFWPTIGIICITGLLGSSLARQQGLAVWTQFNSRMQKGELPGDQIIDGLIILVAGALLLTPGILTDFVGFMGLLPISRPLIRNYAQKRLKTAQANGSIRFTANPFGGNAFNQPFNQSFGQAQQPQTQERETEWQGQAKDRPDSQ
ncbi:MAG: FxsA family protein [Bacteroidota bacterium]